MRTLTITDGISRINLLSLADGYDVDGWRQAISQYKGGGVWNQSSLGDGRQLIAKALTNVLETFPIPAAAHGTQAGAARALQDLLLLCEKASDYWAAEWHTGPVWLEIETDCDVGMRYAILYTANIPELDDVFSPTFVFQAVLRDLSLSVERGQWTDNEPKAGTAVPHGVLYAFDGRNLGNVDDTGAREPVTTIHQDGTAYVRNAHLPANLTDIYIWDQGLAAWDANNYMDVAVPYPFFPGPVVNDAIYFGSDTAVANGGWFNSLVYDIFPVQFDLDIDWEYCTNAVGPVFSALPTQDNTNADGNAPGGVKAGQPFDTTGVNSVHWDSPGVLGNWVPCLIGPGAGITGYWVRAIITGIGGAPVSPQQRNRDIYTISWPYADIYTDETGGQVPSRLKLYLTNQSTSNLDNVGSARTIDGHANRVIVGLRSYDRGANFTAYLLCTTGTQQWANIVFVNAGGAAFVVDIDSSVGYALQRVVGGIEGWAARGEFRLGTPVSDHFYGRYHAYLRAYHAAGVLGSTRVRLGARFGSGADYRIVTDPVVFAGVGANYRRQLLDMGELVIGSPGVITTADEYEWTNITIETECTDGGGGTVRFYELILIPIDEWAAEFKDIGLNPYSTTVPYSRNSSLHYNSYLNADSLANPKAQLRGLLSESGTDDITSSWLTRGNGPAILQTSGRQRLWFLTESNALSISGADIWQSYYHHSMAVQIWRAKQYLGLRGD